MTAHPQTTTQLAASSTGLECLVGGRRVAVPMLHVHQLIEYSRAPLPVAKPGVAGLGVYEGQLVLSLALPFGTSRPDGQTKGVLLRGLPLGLLCALEVDQTFGFVDVSVTESGTNLETWTRAALDPRGEPLLELHVTSLIQALQLEALQLPKVS